MSNHLPLNPEKNVLISIKLDDSNTREIPVSQLPEHIRVEVEIGDEIKKRMSDAYHEYNRLQLSFQGHQTLLRRLLYEEFIKSTTQPEESSEANNDK